ncbi:MAG: hypothetical protein JST12_14630 [Armatimonadetes bacterium]|nr:hypothetical protein [Armatimonadota bacterium]
MKRISTFVIVALLAVSAFANSPKSIDFKLSNAWTPPPANLAIEPVSFQDGTPPVLPQTYAVEAIYDRDTKAAAVGVSAFWKTFTKGSKSFDGYGFGGFDKKQVPVAALLGKFSFPIFDQLSLSLGPAVEWKQGKTLGLTLFAGVTLK